MSLVQVEANNLLNGTCAGTTFTAPTGALKLRLMTAGGSSTSAGTEVSGGSYTSQTITFGVASAGVATSTNAQTYATMPAVTVVGVEIWDSAGTPLRKQFGSITSQAVSAGNTLSFATGAVTSSLT